MSNLPGSLHKVPAGTKCENHPKIPAVYRVQGETDSIGHECADLCEECYQRAEKAEEAYRAVTMDNCEWCKKPFLLSQLRPTRDFSEGSGGPVYEVCSSCRQKQNDAIEAERLLDEEDENY